jgi:glutamate-1-semialdehyde aminotransferase
LRRSADRLRCMHAGMFGFFFTKGPVKCFEDAKQADTAKFGRFHRGMLEHGIYLAPSAYEVIPLTQEAIR